MARNMTEAMIVAKLIWFRITLHFLIPVIMFLQIQTETWSGQTWDETHSFLKWRLLIIAMVPGFSAIAALFDKTSEKIDAALAEHRGDTEFLKKG